MKIYKIDTATESGHNGYRFATSKKEVAIILADYEEEHLMMYGCQHPYYSTHEVQLNKKSIIEFLNIECSHPDNG